MDKQTTISVISNAIGFELRVHEATPREDGILQVEISAEEEEFCHRAAERVYRQIIEGID